MEKVKIGLCQMNVVDNKEKNIEKGINFIKKCKEADVDLVILPEMFNCPYENEKFIEYCEERETSKTLKAISEVSKNEEIYVIAGSIPEKDNGDIIYNTSFFFNDKGEIIDYHRKMHLFDIDVEGMYFKESDTLKSGDKITIVNTPFGKIGIGICYDIRFPELARIMALNGAEILIYPGAFNLTTGPAHWELLFKSRALDNQVFTIGVSPALDKNAEYNAYGHSIIANPWGEVISQCDYSEELKIVEIDLNEISKIRKELPLLKNRRNDLYTISPK